MRFYDGSCVTSKLLETSEFLGYFLKRNTCTCNAYLWHLSNGRCEKHCVSETLYFFSIVCNAYQPADVKDWCKCHPCKYVDSIHVRMFVTKTCTYLIFEYLCIKCVDMSYNDLFTTAGGCLSVLGHDAIGSYCYPVIQYSAMVWWIICAEVSEMFHLHLSLYDLGVKWSQKANQQNVGQFNMWVSDTRIPHNSLHALELIFPTARLVWWIQCYIRFGEHNVTLVCENTILVLGNTMLH